MARILVVEDNQANRKLLAGLLVRHGYEVLAVEDALHIADDVRSFRPDLILMDLKLPGRDGYEAIEIIRADPAGGEVSIFVTSAFALAADIDRARALGVDDYFSKPLDIPRFLQRVDAVLSDRGAASNA